MKKNIAPEANAAAAVSREETALGAYVVVKRVFDIIFSAVALILLCVPMLLICAVIRIDARDKAIFTQKRVGRGGKIFDCYKFRTMKKETPRYCAKKDLENADAFITRTGKFLRKTSMDELPQLWNVLRGDMSFIGPRPLIREENSVHVMRSACGVYRVRPGIPGYAQINGRDLITDERKVELDRYYVEHISLGLDIRILLGTVFKVLREQDIHQGALEDPEE